SRRSLCFLCSRGSTGGTVIGEGPSVRPGSRTGAKAQDGLPGNLGGPTHVHTMGEPGKRDHRLNNDPGPIRRPLSARERCEASTNFGGSAWAPEAKQISDRDGRELGKFEGALYPVKEGKGWGHPLQH